MSIGRTCDEKPRLVPVECARFGDWRAAAVVASASAASAHAPTPCSAATPTPRYRWTGSLSNVTHAPRLHFHKYAGSLAAAAVNDAIKRTHAGRQSRILKAGGHNSSNFSSNTLSRIFPLNIQIIEKSPFNSL